MAGPVAAVKVIDHGKSIYYNNYTNSTEKTTWTAYQYNKNYIYVKYKHYVNNKLQKVTHTVRIIKDRKKIIKLVQIYKETMKNPDKLNSYYSSRMVDYVKYNSTARNFYFKYYGTSFS